jgi:biopolymer transport protein ExbD
MRLRRRDRGHPEIFTGSMADVSFLLLIFFMISSALAVWFGLDLAIPVPSPEADDEVEVEHAIDIAVLADGSLEVDGRPLPITELLAYVGPKLGERPDKPVILRTHPDARYKAMVTVLDTLRSAPDRAGFEVESLVIPTLAEIARYWPPESRFE